MIDPIDRDLFRKADAHLLFNYTDEQLEKIRTVVRDRLGRDADQIELTRTLCNHTGTKSLWGWIGTAASSHIIGSARVSQTPGHKTHIKKLTEMRDRAKALRADIIDELAPSFIIEDMAYRPMTWDADPLNETERAIAALVSVIDASIATQRPQQAANTRKAGRDHFWEEMLAIWIGIGGAETGVDPARFLIAVSRPVFDRVRAIGGSKTFVCALDDENSVVEWLRLRAKARQAATS
jgi:hypothetical protein